MDEGNYPEIVQPGRGIVSSGRGSAQTLTNDDTEALKQIAGVAYVSPELQRRFQIVAAGNNTNSTIIGATAEYPQVRNVSIEQGSFIAENQLRSRGRVAVLGPTVAKDLFADSDGSITAQSIQLRPNLQ